MGARFGSTYTKIGTIQRRLAWPLHKDDTQIHEAFHIFGNPLTLLVGMQTSTATMELPCEDATAPVSVTRARARANAHTHTHTHTHTRGPGTEENQAYVGGMMMSPCHTVRQAAKHWGL